MDWQKRNLFSSAVNMQRGGAVPWPGYVDGGPIMPTQLFEEGDQDINMALNNMSSTTNPSLEQVADTESVSIGPSMEDEMAMDQGPSSEGIKDKYQTIAKQYAMNLVKEGGDMNLFMKQAKQIEIAYANEMEKMGEEITPGNQLMTPEFVQEIQIIFTSDVPEMQTGGTVPPMTKEEARQQIEVLGYGNRFSPAMWISLSEEDREKWKRLSPAINTRSSGVDENKAVMDRLDELLQQRTDLADTTAKQRDDYARRSAEMPLTKQGGFGGFVEQMNAYRANQATNLDAVLQDTTADKAKAIEDAMNAIRYGARGDTSGKSGTIPAAVISDLYGIDDLDKTYKEHMTLQSKGGEKKFDVFSEIPGFIDLYGRLPKSIEESYGLGETKMVMGQLETFYNFYNLSKNITIKAWNDLKINGNMGEHKKRSGSTPVPPKLIWTNAVQEWKKLP